MTITHRYGKLLAAALLLASNLIAAVPSQALESREEMMAEIFGALDFVTQYCSGFESNLAMSNLLLQYTTSLPEKDKMAFRNEVVGFRTELVETTATVPASDVCEFLYTDLLGPTGASGKKSAIWFMRRKS